GNEGNQKIDELSFDDLLSEIYKQVPAWLSEQYSSYAVHRIRGIMQSPSLCGARFPQAPLICHFVFILLRITEPFCREAISSSVALKRPDRSFGGTTDSRASSFIEGSARVYISVVCMFACPSQRDTFRKSLVACRIVRAQVCRSTCGEMCFVDRDGQRVAAARVCLRRMYSKPERVMGSPRALKNSSGTEAMPLTANHDRSADAVSFHSGKQRCLRPLPWTRILALG